MANLNDIKLSAQDILKKQFRSKVKGYDPDEVDAYLDQVISDYETFQQLIEDLYGQIGTLQRQLMDEKQKEKKYRPFESMAEFTKVVYNLVPDNLNITGVGESFTVRRKWNQHIEKVLITHLEYDANHNLISINGQSLKSLFENYEIITDEDKIIPFGVEMKND